MHAINSVVLEGSLIGKPYVYGNKDYIWFSIEWCLDDKNEESVVVTCYVERTKYPNLFIKLEGGRIVRIVGRLSSKMGLCIFAEHVTVDK